MLEKISCILLVLTLCLVAAPTDTRQFSKVILLEETSETSANASVGDLIGDGYPDLIAANRKSPSYVCMNDGTGGFKDAGIVMIPSESATTIVPADFNGDGFIDLAIPHRDGGQSLLFFNDGKGGFAEKKPFGPENTSARAAAAGDLNSDRRIDLVVGDDKRGSLVYLNKGQGEFGDGFQISDPSLAVGAIAIGDMNRDGASDIVMGYATAPGSVFFNKGQGVDF